MVNMTVPWQPGWYKYVGCRGEMAKEDARPLKDVTDDLREDLDGREPGYRLESENKLALALDTSRATVRLALARLVNEGLIETVGKQGGHQVRLVERWRLRMTGRAPFVEPGELEEFPEPVTTRPVIERKVPDTAIAELLRLRRDELAVVHSHFYVVNGRISGQSVTYLAEPIASRIPRLGEVTAGDELADAFQEAGMKTTATRRMITRMPKPTETDAWDILPGVPVFHIRRIGWDSDGEPVYNTVTILAGDRFELEDYSAEDRLDGITPRKPQD